MTCKRSSQCRSRSVMFRVYASTKLSPNFPRKGEARLEDGADAALREQCARLLGTRQPVRHAERAKFGARAVELAARPAAAAATSALPAATSISPSSRNAQPS